SLALAGAIEVRALQFSYTAEQRPVLDDLSFSVSPGEFVALVGPSGSGKSTILRLLLGFERAASASVLYDGRPIEALGMVSLRRPLGVVLQDGRLLSVTRIVIAHRLSTIRDADRILVVDRGRLVQAGGYDALINEPGLFADLARRQLA